MRLRSFGTRGPAAPVMRRNSTGIGLPVTVSGYTYYHATVDPFAGIPPSRLQGALGFFESFVPTYRRWSPVIE